MQIIRNSGTNVPGVVFEFAGDVPPTGSLHCDGSILKRADWPELFGAIKTLWNTSGGLSAPASDEFRLPPTERGGLGLFWRSGNSSQAVGAYGDDSTARPNSAFTTDSKGTHTHTVSLTHRDDIQNGGNKRCTSTHTTDGTETHTTNNTGNHTHSITGGGDNETRPKHVIIKKCIWTGK